MSAEINSNQSISFHDFHHRPSIEQSSISTESSSKLTVTSTPKGRAEKVRFDLNLGMLMSNSRQEFLPGEPNGGTIKYSRQGGIFLSKWGIFSIIAFLIIIATAVGLLVYFFAPCRDQEERVVEDDLSWYIGDLNPRDSEYTVRLLNSVKPSYYRLKIKPNFTSSTFQGNVTITLSTHKPNVKHISLHVQGLEIHNDTVLTEQHYYNKNNSKKNRRDTKDHKESEKVTNSTEEQEKDLNSTATHEVIDEPKEEDKPKNDTVPANHYFGHEIPKYSVTYPNHKKGLNDPRVSITAPTVISQTKAKQVKIISKELNPTIDRLVFTLESHLKPNINYTLHISFKGVMDDSLHGFYRSTYRMNDTLRVLAVTQFEPTSARKAFPCFDEPEYKAAFELSIARPKNMTAISNMPLMSEDEDPEEEDLIWSHFQISVPMSPYLLAFTVNDFEFKDATADNETDEEFEFKIWSRKDLLFQTEYAASIGPKIFDFYEKYFAIPYTLPKIDLVAIPDFNNGAMENWGMLTFLESELLIDEKTGSLQAKKEIAMAMAHELAHQWFGNLVTMKWWNDLWLNEGFATYMEYIGVQEIKPEWDLMDQFNLDKIAVLASDGIESTRPVSTDVKDEMQINQIFDDISYMKAASLLRMLNHVLTDDVFRDGLTKYMTKWQFRNADQNDLWEAFNDAAQNKSSLPKGMTVEDFMDSWTLEAGYPVIYVSRNFENGTANISQKRFYLQKPHTKHAEQLWHIPLTYAYGNTSYNNWTTTPIKWIEKTVNTSITLPEEANSTWVYFNVMAIGHYRVNYDNRNWKFLQYGLYDTPSEFPPVTRAQLLDDAFNLARAGEVSYSIPLDLTKYMIDVETNYLPWKSTLENLYLLYMGMQRTTHFAQFQEYISRLIMPTLEKLGFEELPNDTSQNSLLRDDLIYWACLVEDSKCLDWVEKQFDSWMNDSDPDNNNPIPTNNRMTVYSTAIRAGSKKEYDFLFQRYNNTNDPEMQKEIIMSLPSSRNTWQIYSLLEYSITTMEKKMTPMFWSGVNSDLAAQIAFNFVCANWKRIHDRYANVEGQILMTIIDSAFGNVATEHELRQFKRFVRANKKQLSSVSKTVYQNLEHAVLRIHWGKTKTNEIKKWLDKFAEWKTNTINEFSTL